MKISPIVVSILAAFACLTGYGQATNSQPTAYSLFGITLGKKLPPNCTVSPFDSPVSDDRGFLTYVSMNPPQPNSAFDSNTYLVVLTPTNRLVCKIMAHAFHHDMIADPTGINTFNGVRDALRRHYGKENNFKEQPDGLRNYVETYNWTNGNEEIVLEYFSDRGTFNINCEDHSLDWQWYQQSSNVNTNGL